MFFFTQTDIDVKMWVNDKILLCTILISNKMFTSNLSVFSPQLNVICGHMDATDKSHAYAFNNNILVTVEVNNNLGERVHVFF